MKISIFVVAVTVIVLTALGAAGFFIYKTLVRPEIQKEESPVTIGEISSSTDAQEKPVAENKEMLKETRLIKDNFEITLPPGWQEINDFAESVLVMAVDNKEDTTGKDFKDLEFRTNVSIKSDDMGKYSSLDTLEKYVENIKISLVQLVSGIKFSFEEPRTVNGRNAVFIECESKQKEVDFKTLLVFVEGNDKAIYALSFNTFQSFWSAYQDLFYQIAESFKIRYQL